MLELRAITRTFTLGGERAGVFDVSLSVGSGTVAVLAGPSGSGKTTLLQVAGLLDPPESGEVRLEGKVVSSLPEKARCALRLPKLGFVFQSFNLVPVLSALENVALPLQIQGVDKAEALAKARTGLEEVGLAEFTATRPDKLSGGQRQRVAIARALATRPGMVIADEPTANLDSENSRMVVDLMRQMNQAHGVTFVFTTHDPRLLEHVDRKLLLRDGRIERDEVAQ